MNFGLEMILFLSEFYKILLICKANDLNFDLVACKSSKIWIELDLTHVFSGTIGAAFLYYTIQQEFI